MKAITPFNTPSVIMICNYNWYDTCEVVFSDFLSSSNFRTQYISPKSSNSAENWQSYQPLDIDEDTPACLFQSVPQELGHRVYLLFTHV